MLASVEVASGVDQIINDMSAEVTQEATPEVAAPEQAKDDAPADAPPKEEGSELSPEERVKKLAKAKERDSRKIGRLHAQFAQERERAERLELAIAELTKRFEPKQDALDEAKFETYGDYLKADTQQTVEKTVEEKLAAFQKQQQEQIQQQWLARQQADIDRRVAALEQGDIPDYSNVLEPHIEKISKFPDVVKLALLSVPDAELAVYQMVQEGELDELAYSGFEDAKELLGEYAQKAKAAIKAKKTTKAPAPMAAAKGTGAPGFDLATATPTEIVNWALTKK